MRILHLNLKRKWWEQIRDGEKLVELRRATDFWRTRLVDREYDEIHLKLGYPSAGDDSRIIKRKWNGCHLTTVTHEEFGPRPVAVYSIDVSKEIGEVPNEH